MFLKFNALWVGLCHESGGCWARIIWPCTLNSRDDNNGSGWVVGWLDKANPNKYPRTKSNNIISTMFVLYQIFLNYQSFTLRMNFGNYTGITSDLFCLCLPCHLIKIIGSFKLKISLPLLCHFYIRFGQQEKRSLPELWCWKIIIPSRSPS